MFSGYRQSRKAQQAAIPDPAPNLTSMHETLIALKLAVEALQGVRGDKDDCAVTWGDLERTGAIDKAQVPKDVSQKIR